MTSEEKLQLSHQLDCSEEGEQKNYIRSKVFTYNDLMIRLVICMLKRTSTEPSTVPMKV